MNQFGWGEAGAVLDRTDAFVGVIATDGTLIATNKMALEAAGLRAEDVVGKPLWECAWWNYAPASQDRLKEAIRTASTGQSVRYDAEISVVGNQRLVLDLKIDCETDESGQADLLVFSGIDITDRKRVEHGLQHANATLNSLFDAAPFGLGLWDEQFRYLKLNQHLADINGIGREAHANRRPGELLPDLDTDRIYAIWRDVLESREPRIDATITGATPALPDQVRSWNSHYFPVTLADSTIGIGAFVEETTERRAAEARLAESEARLRHLFSVIDEGYCLCEMISDRQGTAVDYRFLEVNPQFEQMTGLADAVGRTALELVPKLEHYWIDTYARVGFDRETIRLEQGSPEMGRIFDVFATPVESNGRFVIVFRDITERRRADRQRELLISELKHRVKNTLATIQSMAAHTLRHSAEPHTFQENFEARLRAMAAAHDVLFEQEDGASLTKLIEKLTGPYDDLANGRIALGGPNITLSPDATHTLALVVHELTTNAAKYGALSVPGGRLVVNWSILAGGDERKLVINWHERNGPKVQAPSGTAGTTGFGSVMIETALAYSLGGTSTIDYLQDGVKARLELPLESKD